MYSRTIVPKFSKEAISMLNCFSQKLKVDGIATDRTFHTIYIIVESHIQGLHLKDAMTVRLLIADMNRIHFTVEINHRGGQIQVRSFPDTLIA